MGGAFLPVRRRLILCARSATRRWRWGRLNGLWAVSSAATKGSFFKTENVCGVLRSRAGLEPFLSTAPTCPTRRVHRASHLPEIISGPMDVSSNAATAFSCATGRVLHAHSLSSVSLVLSHLPVLVSRTSCVSRARRLRMYRTCGRWAVSTPALGGIS